MGQFQFSTAFWCNENGENEEAQASEPRTGQSVERKIAQVSIQSPPRTAKPEGSCNLLSISKSTAWASPLHGGPPVLSRWPLLERLIYNMFELKLLFGEVCVLNFDNCVCFVKMSLNGLMLWEAEAWLRFTPGPARGKNALWTSFLCEIGIWIQHLF